MTLEEATLAVEQAPQAYYHCIFCEAPAVGVYYLPEGCAALPDVQLQPLCKQHEVKSHPHCGLIQLTSWVIPEPEILTPGGLWTPFHRYNPKT